MPLLAVLAAAAQRGDGVDAGGLEPEGSERGPKQSIPVAAVAALLLLAAPVAGQEEKCDAKPRWIAVDVVRGYVDNNHGGFETLSGLQLVDRCKGFAVTEVRGGARSMAQEAAADGARSVISQINLDSNGKVAVSVYYYVRESVHQICAAMDDCGDAVRQAQEEGER